MKYKGAAPNGRRLLFLGRSLRHARYYLDAWYDDPISHLLQHETDAEYLFDRPYGSGQDDHRTVVS
ncbi:protein of unknown function [Methylocaldum szegediense]|uniref:Transposase n=1 Tax=Methylocaldum szegediense TaxID=73780 RepID=A0ABN8XC86_9GAMM|nr:protein of unknown function [Methylocaldum szegediense]